SLFSFQRSTSSLPANLVRTSNSYNISHSQLFSKLFLKTFISLKAAIYIRSEAARNNISQHSYVGQPFFEYQ
ncbi:hypothetical protein, partial [Paenibacillus lautus]